MDQLPWPFERKHVLAPPREFVKKHFTGFPGSRSYEAEKVVIIPTDHCWVCYVLTTTADPLAPTVPLMLEHQPSSSQSRLKQARLEPPQVEPRIVLEVDEAVGLEAVEDAPQIGDHLVVAWLAGLRRV